MFIYFNLCVSHNRTQDLETFCHCTSSASLMELLRLTSISCLIFLNTFKSRVFFLAKWARTTTKATCEQGLFSSLALIGLSPRLYCM